MSRLPEDDPHELDGRNAVLEAALNQVREAVYLLDEQGKPHYVNDEAWRMLGHERAMLLSLSVWDVDAQRSPERWARGWADLKTARRRQFETEHRTRDGRLIPVEVEASYVVHRGRGYSLALVRDISERKRAEQEFRALVENSPDTVVRYNRECRRIFVNPALLRAAGVSQESLLGRRPGEGLATSPEIARAFEGCVRGVLENGRDAVFDLNWRNARGDAMTSQIRLVAERKPDGTVTGVLAIGRDISALMETQRQLRALSEAHPDIIVRFDAEGRIVDVGPMTMRRFGRPLEDYLGRTMPEVNPQYGPPAHASVLQVAATGQPNVLELPYPMQGELRYFEVRYVPEVGPQGRVTGVLSVARDITERREAEQTIRELHQRREAAREEERRHIARELHDEMGQRLSALRMQVALLRLRGADPALRATAEELQAMVDQTIHVVRNLASSLRPPALDLGIAAALEWLVEDLRKSARLACHLHVDETELALDAQQTTMVFRIVQESLTNVVRHAAARRVDVTLARRGGDWALSVHDDGRGFDAAAPRRSLGLLGLRERAQMLGGQLEIRSAPGKGTLLTVAFPGAQLPG